MCCQLLDADMNVTLTQVLMKACICPVLLGERFAVEHMMLLALLHCRVGTEVGQWEGYQSVLDLLCSSLRVAFCCWCSTGAYFLQSLAEKFRELHCNGPNYGQGKECDCVILLFSHLYNFKVSSSQTTKGPSQKFTLCSQWKKLHKGEGVWPGFILWLKKSIRSG